MTSSTISISSTTATAPAPSLTELVGETIVARMRGQRPSKAFLRRVELGQISGVALFSDNYGPAGPKQLIDTLQHAARRGGQPPLLIAVDQEGGIVKRLSGAPSLAPAEMLTPTIAEAQGLATARNLSQYGINTDLAPVMDIGRGGFITPRSFGPTAAIVTARATAFARGLARGSVLATAKHFPGLGYASTTTDTGTVTVTATQAQLNADLATFTAAIKDGVSLVMVSTALYPALDRREPAALSKPIINGLLRGKLGYGGVVITDAIDTPAVHHYASTGAAAVQAIEAGADLVLAAGVTATDADTASRSAYNAELAAARSGALPLAELEASYQRVTAMRSHLRWP